MAEQVSHGAIQFMVYEELKRQLSGRSSTSEPRVLTAVEITLVGAASKLFATLSTYPFSVSLFTLTSSPANQMSGQTLQNLVRTAATAKLGPYKL